jgi:hypothetical protein
MIETLFRTAAVTFLGAWFVLSILTVLWRRSIARRRWDVFGMLSGWRLFLTADGMHPTARPILYRDRFADGTMGPMMPVARGTIAWTPRFVFWHPQSDFEILLRRLTKALQREIRGNPRAAACTFPAYRHLLHIVSQLPRTSPSATARQFIVLGTYGDLSGQAPRRIFESDFHPV